jgi:putative phosphoribosyl transferase
MGHLYNDRTEAGERLAQALRERGYQGRELQILGIPRGGMVVAAAVARALDAPLDLMLARKLRAPSQPEVAIGAVAGSGDPEAASGEPLIDGDLARAMAATPEYLAQEVREQQRVLATRSRAYRGDRPTPVLEGQTAILVDDGIATGYTFRAALDALRRQRVGRLVAAVPVAETESLDSLREAADEVVCLATPEPFWTVGVWYREFPEVSDEEVLAVLNRSWSR